MPTTLTVTIPLPPNVLKPNARVHWAAKARAVKRYRIDCGWAADDAINRSGWQTVERATVTPIFYHRINRHRDGDNALASIKAGLDGLADAGVIVDDRGFACRPVEFRVDRKDPRVELIITAEQTNV